MRFTEFLRVSVLLFGGAGTALAVVAIAGAARRRRHLRDRRGAWAGGRWRRPAGCGSGAGWRRPRASAACWPGRAPPTRCPSSSRAPCSSTASGRSRCSRSARGARGVPVPAGAGDRRRLRDRRGAHLAQAVRRPSRRSRTATACASSSTAARRSARRSCCAPRGRARSSRRPRRRAGGARLAAALAQLRELLPASACWPLAPASARRGARWPRRSACWPASRRRARRSRSRSARPPRAAARACTSSRSRRLGLALISRKVPVRAAASITRSTSTA